MKKRNLFDELKEGFTALADQRDGERTLRTYTVKLKAVPKLSAVKTGSNDPQAPMRKRRC
ncbi:MAG TPA: hypothetical protein VK629_06155 [Steroidobacteraceae bacterium]|nr:hypothetical protein [Steroidobacteraceae bacterium]